MLKDVKLSIIIPVYNGEKFIQHCLDKVLQIDLNKEIIVINDGSTDGSLQLLQAYGDKIILISYQQNHGISHARNLGLARATGDYIATFDVDDDFELDMHTKILTKMIQTGADVGMCNFDYIDFDGQMKKTKFSLNYDDLPQPEVIRLFLTNKIPSVIWTSIYRATLAKSIRLENIDCSEDMLYQFKIMLAAQKTCFIDETLYHYVQHSTSVMHSLSMSDFLIKHLEVPNYLSVTEKKILDCRFPKEYEYFKLKLLQNCVHSISGEAHRNKKEAKRLLQSILSKDACRATIKNQYFPKCIKFEFLVIKNFGVGFHLFMFPFYQLLRRIFMPKGIKW